MFSYFCTYWGRGKIGNDEVSYTQGNTVCQERFVLFCNYVLLHGILFLQNSAADKSLHLKTTASKSTQVPQRKICVCQR